ncbi:MAG: transferrin-binding protein-like solute binding protein [Neisseriaceae bacterium]|nr:transferrin-binding protein-like solute binding protein [Neisseriaceae bacterium]
MKKLAILLTAITLTACGGGSDDNGTTNPVPTDCGNCSGNNVITNSSSGNSNNSPSQTNTTEENPTINSNIDIGNNSWIATGDNDNGTLQLSPAASKFSFNKNDYKTFKVGGKTFNFFEHDADGVLSYDELEQDPQTVEKWDKHYEINNNQFVILAIGPTQGKRGTAYARYGLLDLDSDVENNIPAYLTTFYHGEETTVTSMPTTGTAHYSGLSLGLNPKNFKYGETYTADIEIDVDFANKVLDGKMNNWRLRNEEDWTAQEKSQANIKNPSDIRIAARISGNEFKGKTNNVSTEGKFYGPNAENIAGAFNDKNQNVQGVFGANRQ